MAEATVTPHAITQTVMAAKVMALMASELVLRPELLAQAQADLAAKVAGR